MRGLNGFGCAALLPLGPSRPRLSSALGLPGSRSALPGCAGDVGGERPQRGFAALHPARGCQGRTATGYRPFPLSVPSRRQRRRRTPRAPRCPEPGSTAARRGPPSPSVLPREHRSSPCSVLLCEGRASARECAVVNSHVRRGVAGLLFVHLFHFLSGKDCSRAQFWGSEA